MISANDPGLVFEVSCTIVTFDLTLTPGQTDLGADTWNGVSTLDIAALHILLGSSDQETGQWQVARSNCWHTQTFAVIVVTYQTEVTDVDLTTQFPSVCTLFVVSCTK